MVRKSKLCCIIFTNFIILLIAVVVLFDAAYCHFSTILTVFAYISSVFTHFLHLRLIA